MVLAVCLQPESRFAQVPPAVDDTHVLVIDLNSELNCGCEGYGHSTKVSGLGVHGHHGCWNA